MCIKEKSGEEGLEIAHNRLSMRGALGPVSTMTNKQTNKVEKKFGSKMWVSGSLYLVLQARLILDIS